MTFLIDRRTILQSLAAATLPRIGLAQDQKAPVAVQDGMALVKLADLEKIEPGNWLGVRFQFPPNSAQILGPEATGAGYRLLRRLYFEGRAAGNHGDLYDNLDHGHSQLPPGAHPQLTQVAYDEAARKAGLDYGIRLKLLFNAPVIGNSSTALTAGAFWRSQVRLALTSPDGPDRLARVFASGALRVFPEHNDFDPKLGDLFPANTPYTLISQGSSGSDLPHLEALAMILAAFRPDTKEMLKRTGLIAPTLQMVYRRARQGISDRDIYLSGRAHPAVFDASGINLAHMVALANAITPDTVPPMPLLEVEREDTAREGVDFFGDGLGERLFDTPSAIARVWRSRAGRRVFVVSAQATHDPNGRPLHFSWVLLQGDPAKVRIEPLDDAGTRAQITLNWQKVRAVPGRRDILSSRIDIGVFAHNGVYDSAPAFLSVVLPRHERRDYENGPDGAPRPVSIDWRAGLAYVDPAIFPAIGWRDEYLYDPSGNLTGWIRRQRNEELHFDALGRLIRSNTPRPVSYPLLGEPGDAPRVEMRLEQE